RRRRQGRAVAASVRGRAASRPSPPSVPPWRRHRLRGGALRPAGRVEGIASLAGVGVVVARRGCAAVEGAGAAGGRGPSGGAARRAPRAAPTGVPASAGGGSRGDGGARGLARGGW